RNPAVTAPREAAAYENIEVNEHKENPVILCLDHKVFAVTRCYATRANSSVFIEIVTLVLTAR
ncbi:MAG: hypothetical protein ACRDL8_11075, partial [Solirubrobacteraceae bacterium]